jgi:ubiquinone/menaquinone biosynthesis C-methylase UbiE
MQRKIVDEVAPPLHIKTAIHGKFYLWARQFVRGKTVLDIGCGDGRGAALLAESALNVTGIDADSYFVDRANQSFGFENLDFKVMDCSSLAIPTGSIDVVVSNALLEYLPDPAAFFAEARRVLRAEGRIICGTKNLVRSLKGKDGGPLYRNHLQEFTKTSLTEIMSNDFKNFQLYGETMASSAETHIMDSRALGIERLLVALNIKQLFPVALRRRIRRLVTGVDLASISPDDFEISEKTIDDALYIICVADAK